MCYSIPSSATVHLIGGTRGGYFTGKDKRNLKSSFGNCCVGDDGDNRDTLLPFNWIDLLLDFCHISLSASYIAAIHCANLQSRSMHATILNLATHSPLRPQNGNAK